MTDWLQCRARSPEGTTYCARDHGHEGQHRDQVRLRVEATVRHVKEGELRRGHVAYLKVTVVSVPAPDIAVLRCDSIVPDSLVMRVESDGGAVITVDCLDHLYKQLDNAQGQR